MPLRWSSERRGIPVLEEELVFAEFPLLLVFVEPAKRAEALELIKDACVRCQLKFV